MQPLYQSLIRRSLTILLLSLLCIINISKVFAQPAHAWSANWIAMYASAEPKYGVFYFRKSINLESKPTQFKVHVSADNRYKLYVDEKLVSLGPARGDMYSWKYETVDLAPFLKQGKNIIAALVFNEAEFRPVAQISLQTAFMLQGATKESNIINTNKSWKCWEEKAYKPFPGWFPIAASKGEIVDMNQLVDGWQKVDLDDRRWANARELFEVKPKGQGDGFGWMLEQSEIPQMEMTDQRITTLRTSTGMTIPKAFPKTKTALTIPANTR